MEISIYFREADLAIDKKIVMTDVQKIAQRGEMIFVFIQDSNIIHLFSLRQIAAIRERLTG